MIFTLEGVNVGIQGIITSPAFLCCLTDILFCSDSGKTSATSSIRARSATVHSDNIIKVLSG